MDPLSIAAGAIAVVTASAETVQGLEKIWSLKHRGQEFVGLWNQTNAIRALLWANDIALRNIRDDEKDTSRIQDCLANVNNLLDQATDIFSTLDKALRETSNGGNPVNQKPSKKDWFRRKSKLTGLTNQASTLLMSLNATLSTLQSVQASSIANHTDVKIDLVLTKIEAMRITGFQGRPTNVIDQVQVDVENVSTEESHSATDPSASRRASVESFHSALSSSSSSSGTTLVSLSGSLSLQTQCENGSCPCRCHQSSQSKLPWLLSKLVGSFTVHGNGSILLNRKPCDKPHCQRNGSPRVQVSYVAPAGFFLPAINFHVNAETHRGLMPSWSLFVPNIIPDNAPVWSIIELGNASEFKGMLARRETSPTDMTRSGTTLLKYAAIKGQIEIYSILVGEKADPFYRDETGTMAIQPGFDRHFSNCDLDRNVSGKAETLSDLFKTSKVLELQGFTPLHLFLLRLRPLPTHGLEDHLMYSRDNINEPDAMGRTPLLWAAWRGDHDNVRLLLEYGADVDSSDNQGWTPLAKACKGGNLKVSCLLIDAATNKAAKEAAKDAAKGKSKATFKSAVSLTKPTLNGMQPIHFACDNRRIGGTNIVRLLIENGADVNAYSKDYGTPLHNAANRGSLATLQYLLELGADVNARDSDGNTPLVIALACWNEPAFDLLIQSGAQLDLVRNDGWGIFHVATWFSSTKVWELLLNLLDSDKLGNADIGALHDGHDIQACFDKCRGLRYPRERNIEEETRLFGQMMARTGRTSETEFC